jgi:hypothetical protein
MVYLFLKNRSLELTIEEIEEKLNVFLPRNYNFLDEETGEVCKNLVIEYVKKIDCLKNKKIIFIKKLTKTISHIVETGCELDEYLEKIYNFNLEGCKLDFCECLSTSQ